MNNLNSFFCRFCRFVTLRSIVITIFALVWSGFAFGQKIIDASWDGNLEIVTALIKNKPKLVFRKNKIGQTPLIVAANRDHKDVVELLLANGADVNARDREGGTALVETLLEDYKDIEELLIANKADVNVSEWGSGKTPLMYAAERGQMDLVELLLANNADVNAKNKYGITPLFYAAENDHIDVVKLLIANKADVNVVIQGQTPLINAAEKGQTELVKLLLASGADSGAEINVKNDFGMTRLALAAYYERKEAVVLLLAAGADPNVKDKVGMTPFQNAAFEGKKDIVALLYKYGGEQQVEVLIAALTSSNGGLTVWQVAHILANIEDPKAANALLSAFSRREIEVIAGAYQFFIQKGIPGSQGILIEALESYPDKSAAEAYLNCGEPKLVEAARKWANAQGYWISSFRNGEGGPKWGSGQR